MLNIKILLIIKKLKDIINKIAKFKNTIENYLVQI